MIALISIDPSFGNCVGLYKALSLRDDVCAVFEQKDEKGFHEKIPCTFGFKNIPPADKYVVVSSGAFLRAFTPKEKTSVILTDSYYLNHHKEFDYLLKGYSVFCMADLSKYCKVDHKLYYPPFEYDGKIVKNKELTIAHSPYNKIKREQKGTERIEDAVKDMDLNLDIIVDSSWDESILRKSKAHMFIDQIAMREYGYIGGMAKSGLEAITVSCLTFTSGEPVDGDIPAPPVEWIDNRTIINRLKSYIDNDSRIDARVKEQSDWSKEYLSYEFQSKYLV